MSEPRTEAGRRLLDGHGHRLGLDSDTGEFGDWCDADDEPWPCPFSQNLAAIEAEAARAAVEARDRELRAVVEAERREPPWPQFGVPSGLEATACDAYNAALDAVLHLLSPAAD